MMDKELINLYIQKHRDMWHWIAEQLKTGIKDSMETLKNRYLEEYDPENQGEIYQSNSCYLCYIVDNIYGKCDACPVQWPYGYYSCISYTETETIEKSNGLFVKILQLMNDGKLEEAAELAEQIANLPVKGEY